MPSARIRRFSRSISGTATADIVSDLAARFGTPSERVGRRLSLAAALAEIPTEDLDRLLEGLPMTGREELAELLGLKLKPKFLRRSNLGALFEPALGRVDVVRAGAVAALLVGVVLDEGVAAALAGKVDDPAPEDLDVLVAGLVAPEDPAVVVDDDGDADTPVDVSVSLRCGWSTETAVAYLCCVAVADVPAADAAWEAALRHGAVHPDEFDNED